eukprot:TRINITY_DN5359_c0_g1_i1.p1 TRINITY_DN5359_c0_g1~~TRINITY_DN5359_c0_g1_i1.p1  ORF type:complete len:209 (+),score=96.80 TRINITY_DN5359_c0_g1_i1:611-1237(+)
MELKFSLLVYNLVNSIDIEATTEKVNNYRRENEEITIRNRSKKAEFEREMKGKEDTQKREALERLRLHKLEEERLQQEKIQQKEEMLDNLASGKISAASLKEKQMEKHTSMTKTNAPVTKPILSYVPSASSTSNNNNNNNLYQNTKAQPNQSASFSLPKPMTAKEPVKNYSEEELAERAKKAFKAGGWTDQFISKRAMEEAFNCLVLQ